MDNFVNCPLGARAIYKIALQEFNLIIQNIRVKTIALDPINHFFQKPVRVTGIIRHARKGEGRAVRRVQFIHFRRRYVKSITHARENWLDDVPLAFERIVAKNFELDGADADDHEEIFDFGFMILDLS